MPAASRTRALIALPLASFGLIAADLAVTPATAATPTASVSAQVSTEDGARAGDGERLTRRERARRVRRVALNQIGDPYAYGASGPGAFDCSGLIYYSSHRMGFRHVPRTSSAQAGHMRRIRKRDLRPGDFMFFTGSGGVYHAAIFVRRLRNGAPLMVHASRPGTPVKRDVPWTRSWFAGTLRGL